jgi:hypothetical protein
VILLPLFQGKCWFRFCHQRGGKGSGYSKTGWRKQNNIPDSDGFEAYLKGPQVDKETDLTQYPQLFLIRMMGKDPS